MARRKTRPVDESLALFEPAPDVPSSHPPAPNGPAASAGERVVSGAPPPPLPPLVKGGSVANPGGPPVAHVPGSPDAASDTLVLVPTGLLAKVVRARGSGAVTDAEPGPDGVPSGGRCLSLDDFAIECRAGAERSAPVPSGAARTRALRRLTAARATLNPEGDFATRVAGRPGLRAALWSWFEELRRRGVTAADLAASAEGSDEVARETAALFADVVAGVPSPEDRAWLAAAELRAGGPLPACLADVRRIVVRGADLLGPGTEALLQAAAGRGIPVEWRCPLPRSAVGRLPALGAQLARWQAAAAALPAGMATARFADELAEAGGSDLAGLRSAWLGGGDAEPGPPASCRTAASERVVSAPSHPPAPPLVKGGTKAEPSPVVTGRQAAGDGSVRLLYAPGDVREADLLAAEVRRMLAADATLRPPQIAVVMVRPAGQRELLEERFARAGLPTFRRRGGVLAELPWWRAVRAWMGLADPRATGRQITAVMQSAYLRRRPEMTLPDGTVLHVDGGMVEELLAGLDWTGTAGETLDARMARRGRELDRLEAAAAETSDPGRAARRRADVQRTRMREQAVHAGIREVLATVRTLAVETDIGRLTARLAEAWRTLFPVTPGAGPEARRDRRTAALAERVLEEVRDAHPVGEPVRWAELLDDLDAQAGVRALGDTGVPGGVFLLTPQEVGGLRFRVVAVPGMAAGAFPRRDRREPFLTAARRAVLSARLTAAGRTAWPEPDEPADVDGVLFGRILAAAGETLILGAPVTVEGRGSQPVGAFFEDAEEHLAPVLPSVRRTWRAGAPAGGVDALHHPADAAVRFALQVRSGACSGAEPTHVDGRQAAATTAALWDVLAGARPEIAVRLLRSAGIERSRMRAMDGRRAGRHCGAVGAVGRPLSGDGQRTRARHLRSAEGEVRLAARAVETFGTCPFRFAVEEVLGLAPLPRPDDAPDPPAMGTVLHRVLERFYRDPGRRRRPPDATVDAAELRRMAAEEMERLEPARPGSAEAGTARATLEGRLDTFLAADAEFRSSQGARPVLLEHDIDGVPIDTGAGRRVLLAGRVDRIDIDGAGRPVVIDYKDSSRGADPEGFELGTAVQVGLYALAIREGAGQPGGPAEALRRAAAAEGLSEPRCDSPRGAYVALKLAPDQAVVEEPMLEAGEDWADALRGHLRRCADAVEGAGFAVHPVEGSCRWCAWEGVCRRGESIPVRVARGEESAGRE